MRIIIGGLVGGVVYFIWAAISWTVLPWHNATMKTLPNEEAVLASLSVNVSESGSYYFPAMPHGDLTAEEKATAEHKWQERHKLGPVGMLFIHAGGKDPMPPDVFLKSFINDVLAALLVALIVAKNTLARGFAGRASCATIMGLFAGLAGIVPNWIWMHHPADYVFTGVADLAIGWTIAGCVIAAIVKSRSLPAATGSVPGVVEPG